LTFLKRGKKFNIATLRIRIDMSGNSWRGELLRGRTRRNQGQCYHKNEKPIFSNTIHGKAIKKDVHPYMIGCRKGWGKKGKKFRKNERD